MINATTKDTTIPATTRFELIPRFSERRLLLIVGDIVMIALAGGLAIWLNGLLR
ncbi:MAG: hypothetical protein RMK84_01200 [Oscillochloridaceae bacterium]|nr:hypothetical protein [Chloroflexaceae bacterium]MDW8388715.1 hypothetical protein [Oscillochloridaceae bacterium]